MAADERTPSDPLAFIRRCIADGRVFWTYHVNMRLRERSIARASILGAAASYEIIEAYPGDKYMPSYLVYARDAERVFHVLFATDVEDGNVRIVTAYEPDRSEWMGDLKTRRTQP